MTKLYVAEYSGLAATAQSDSVVVVPAPPTAEQVVDYTAGVAASTAFNPSTTFVEVSTDAICSIAFGTAPVAAITNCRLNANERKLFRVPAGQAYKVSAITNT